MGYFGTNLTQGICVGMNHTPGRTESESPAMLSTDDRTSAKGASGANLIKLAVRAFPKIVCLDEGITIVNSQI